MTTKAPQLDRVLEALSPTLAAEIERIVAETREALQAEFDQKLQTTVQNAEESTRKTADESRQAIERATEETREAVRKQVTDEVTTAVTQELEAKFNQALAAQKSELEKAQEEWVRERDQLKQQVNQWRVFSEAQRQLGEASSQPEMLIRCLKLAEPFAASVALYTAKADGLALWKGRGKAAFPQVISEQITDPDTYFKKIVVRGKTVAAISAHPPFRTEVLDFLASSMERAIELFGLKLRGAASPKS